MNPLTPQIAYDRISKPRFWLSCAVSPVFLCVGIAFLRFEHIGWQLAGGAILALGLLMPIQRKMILDKSRALLRETHRFLGFFPIWQRSFQLVQFDAVVVERRETYHPSGPRAESQDYDILYRIGLRRKAGRPYWIRDESFRCGQSDLRVEEFAHRLSCDTGFEIVEVEV